ncbi:MAG: MarR family transcriptional regulator [Rhizobiaceae bacterium]|nr:MarR family transcriptional regulator [Rhizobiaceae bacterium]
MTKTMPAASEAEEEAMERISGAMTRNRLMTRRRIIGRLAIARVAPALEITHLDVLDVVSRVEAPAKATIGAVAEGMRIAPSRASRIVAELVAQNVLERRVCQSDARRSILVITPKGRKLLEEIHAVKRGLIESVTESWPAEDIDAFSRLYDRFVAGVEDYVREHAGEDERHAVEAPGVRSVG